MIKQCSICERNFKSWHHYQEHQRQRHNITDETGVPRLNLTLGMDQARVYKPMDLLEKQIAVTKVELAIREMAWISNQLNPLIGCDKISVEPVWNKEREVI
jgi:hypothetical protein